MAYRFSQLGLTRTAAPVQVDQPVAHGGRELAAAFQPRAINAGELQKPAFRIDHANEIHEVELAGVRQGVASDAIAASIMDLKRQGRRP